MKNPFEELKEVSPATAVELDFVFFSMAPPPLGENPTQEEENAFEARLSEAERICDALAEEYLKRIRP